MFSSSPKTNLLRFILILLKIQARAGLTLIASLLLDPLSSSTLLASGPLNPYPFSKIPNSLLAASELMRAKFSEARENSTSYLLSRSTSTSTSGSCSSSSSSFDEREIGEVIGEDELEAMSKRKRENEEPGRIWRMRWRMAVRRGVYRFRERICNVTGLLCEEEGC